MPVIKNNLLDIKNLVSKLNLKQGSSVADLGCGAFGYFTFVLAKIVGKSGKVYAVDIIKDNLENIKKRAKLENLSQVKTVWSDLEVFKATKIKDNSLDSALLINVLHQSSKYKNILKEAYRILKPGGLLLIVEWNEVDSPYILSQDNKIDLKILEKNAKLAKFQILENFTAGTYHYGLLLQK